MAVARFVPLLVFKVYEPRQERGKLLLTFIVFQAKPNCCPPCLHYLFLAESIHEYSNHPSCYLQNLLQWVLRAHFARNPASRKIIYHLDIQYGEAKVIPFMYTKGINFASPYCSQDCIRARNLFFAANFATFFTVKLVLKSINFISYCM